MGLDMNFYKKIYLDPMKKGRKYPTVRVGKYKKSWCMERAKTARHNLLYRENWTLPFGLRRYCCRG